MQPLVFFTYVLGCRPLRWLSKQASRMCSSPYNRTLRHRWEQRCRSTASLTLALEEVCGQRYVLAALLSGKKTPVTNCTRVCVGVEASLEGCGKPHPTGVRILDRPARGEWLYRLRYPGCNKAANITHNRLSIREKL